MSQKRNEFDMDQFKGPFVTLTAINGSFEWKMIEKEEKKGRNIE